MKTESCTFRTTGRVAICTQYRGPTDTRGARIRVTCEHQTAKTYPYPHELNQGEAHASCAAMYAQEHGWAEGHWVGGALPDGKGYAFVRTIHDLWPDRIGK